MSERKMICIAGGIGSGKSVVSRILRLMGHEVYDCDIEASRLMESDPELRRAIEREVMAQAYDNEGRLRRKELADCIFSDEERRLRLNAIVHKAVREEVREVRSQMCEVRDHPLFVESAIAAESGLAEMADAIWLVTTYSEGERIERICRRNSVTRAEAATRIESQRGEYEKLEAFAAKTVRICNDKNHPLLPQILKLIKNKI